MKKNDLEQSIILTMAYFEQNQKHYMDYEEVLIDNYRALKITNTFYINYKHNKCDMCPYLGTSNCHETHYTYDCKYLI